MTTFKITSKNIKTKAAISASLNEVVFQLAPKHTNEEIIALLDKQGREYSMNSLRWYASKARAGVRR
jgi:hypothetical protein